MYEWFVARMSADMALGVGLSVFVLLLFLFFWAVFVLLRRPSVYGALAPINLRATAPVDVEKAQPPTKSPTRPEGQGSRLTLCDSVVIDDERRLVLVRRDDVEHLILVGGTGDMVIEHNIPVDTGAIDTVSMLAIARAEDADFVPARPSFLPLGEDGDIADTPVLQGQDNNHEPIKDNGAAPREGAPLPENTPQLLDEKRNEQHERKQSVDLNGSQGAAQTPFEGRMAEGKVDSEIVNKTAVEPVEKATPRQVSEQNQVSVGEQVPAGENGKQEDPPHSDLTMASLFPGSMTGASHMASRSIPSMPVASEPVVSHLKPDRPSVEEPTNNSRNSLNTTTQQTKNKIQEPPVASYFAGQTKKTGLLDASSTDPAQRSTPENIKGSSSESTPTVKPTSRILPLNPFIQPRMSDAPPPQEQPSQAKHPPAKQSHQNAAPASEAVRGENVLRAVSPSAPHAPARAETAREKAVTSPQSSSLNIVNSFLGLSLGQLSKTGTDAQNSATSISTIQENTSISAQKSVIPMKGSSS